MIDLKNEYLQNAYKDEYYVHSFGVPYKFEMVSDLWIVDDDDAINNFKELIMPYNTTNPLFDLPRDEMFIYLCNYLHNKGFIIEEFPDFLARPTDRWDFSYNKIRNKIIEKDKENKYIRGVPWKDRRKFIGDLHFCRNTKLNVSEEIKDILKSISTRDANFLEMENDEKLECICNCIEYLLKPNKKSDKFIELDYTDSCGYLSNEIVREYRNKLECFRHSTREDLNKRKELSKEQKDFLVSFGVIIIDFINSKIDK